MGSSTCVPVLEYLSGTVLKPVPIPLATNERKMRTHQFQHDSWMHPTTCDRAGNQTAWISQRPIPSSSHTRSLRWSPGPVAFRHLSESLIRSRQVQTQLHLSMYWLHPADCSVPVTRVGLLRANFIVVPFKVCPCPYNLSLMSSW